MTVKILKEPQKITQPYEKNALQSVDICWPQGGTAQWAEQRRVYLGRVEQSCFSPWVKKRGLGGALQRSCASVSHCWALQDCIIGFCGHTYRRWQRWIGRQICGEKARNLLHHPYLPLLILTCSASLNHQTSLDSDATLLEELHHLRVCESLHWLLVNFHNQVALAQARAAKRLQHLFDPLARSAVRNSEAKTINALHHGQGEKFSLGCTWRRHGDAVRRCGAGGGRKRAVQVGVARVRGKQRLLDVRLILIGVSDKARCAG